MSASFPRRLTSSPGGGWGPSPTDSLLKLSDPAMARKSSREYGGSPNTDAEGNPHQVEHNVEALNGKVASVLHVKSQDISIRVIPRTSR